MKNKFKDEESKEFKEIKIVCGEDSADPLEIIKKSASYKESKIAYFVEKCKLTSEKLKSLLTKSFEVAVNSSKIIKVVFFKPFLELSEESQKKYNDQALLCKKLNSDFLKSMIFEDEMEYFTFKINDVKYHLGKYSGVSGVLNKDYNVNPGQKGGYFLIYEICDENNKLSNCFECTLIGHGPEDIVS